MPNPALVPSLGRTCGRREREGRARRPGNGALRARDGERHPGLPERGSLRGAPLERRPRSVRHAPIGSLPLGRSRRRQRVSPGSPRRGTCLRTRTRRTNPARAAPPATSSERHVLHSVQGPGSYRSLGLPRRKASGTTPAARQAQRASERGSRAPLTVRLRVSRVRRIDSGQTCSAGGTGDGAPRGGRTPARRASPTISKEVAPRDASEPGRRSRPPSRTRGHEELVTVRARTS
jgi:hypothetical protein